VKKTQRYKDEDRDKFSDFGTRLPDFQKIQFDATKISGISFDFKRREDSGFESNNKVAHDTFKRLKGVQDTRQNCIVNFFLALVDGQTMKMFTYDNSVHVGHKWDMKCSISETHGNLTCRLKKQDSVDVLKHLGRPMGHFYMFCSDVGGENEVHLRINLVMMTAKDVRLLVFKDKLEENLNEDIEGLFMDKTDQEKVPVGDEVETPKELTRDQKILYFSRQAVKLLNESNEIHELPKTNSKSSPPRNIQYKNLRYTAIETNVKTNLVTSKNLDTLVEELEEELKKLYEDRDQRKYVLHVKTKIDILMKWLVYTNIMASIVEHNSTMNQYSLAEIDVCRLETLIFKLRRTFYKLTSSTTLVMRLPETSYRYKEELAEIQKIPEQIQTLKLMDENLTKKIKVAEKANALLYQRPLPIHRYTYDNKNEAILRHFVNGVEEFENKLRNLWDRKIENDGKIDDMYLKLDTLNKFIQNSKSDASNPSKEVLNKEKIPAQFEDFKEFLERINMETDRCHIVIR